MGRRLLQSERNANLLIEVLRSLVAEQKFQLHDFIAENPLKAGLIGADEIYPYCYRSLAGEKLQEIPQRL